jgi:hypothetical protein
MKTLLTIAFLLVPLALWAEPLSVEGVKLGAPRSDVLKLPQAKAAGGKVTVSPADTVQVDVDFDAKGKASRIYASYRKGLFPMKDYSQKYGDPVKREKNGNLKYIFTVAGEGTITLEKEKGYPGYYIELVK